MRTVFDLLQVTGGGRPALVLAMLIAARGRPLPRLALERACNLSRAPMDRLLGALSEHIRAVKTQAWAARESALALMSEAEARRLGRYLMAVRALRPAAERAIACVAHLGGEAARATVLRIAGDWRYALPVDLVTVRIKHGGCTVLVLTSRGRALCGMPEKEAVCV